MSTFPWAKYRHYSGGIQWNPLVNIFRQSKDLAGIAGIDVKGLSELLAKISARIFAKYCERSS